MKKLITLTILLSLAIACFSGCGMYTCDRCDATAFTVYYTISGEKEDAICADCAEKYWKPFDYRNYKVR